MKTVAFYQPFLNERGTCVAMFDYAHFNQTLLGNKSLFIYDSLDSRNEKNGLKRFKDNFQVYDFQCGNCSVEKRIQLIDEIITNTNTDYIYMSKLGVNDGVISKRAKTLIHVMGMINPDQAHGDVYAYVSYFSTNACSGGKYPAVPFMVNLPDEKDNMRQQLGIPNDAIVIGRHGGIDTFDMPWAYEVIKTALLNRTNLYFVFLNTPKFIDHQRVIFLDTIVDLHEKVKFINTCDAMLHVRFIGETFGMACAEFSTLNKPVITWFGSRERNHIEILGEKGIYYNTPQDLYNILINFVPNNSVDWNCYGEYTPEKIMKIFDEIYLR